MRYFKFLPNRPRKVVVFCLANVLLVASVKAEEEWLSRSQRILHALNGQAKPVWLESNPYQSEANRQALELIQNSNAMQSISASSNPLDKTVMPLPGKPLKVVFVSFSLGDTALKGIFEEASGQDDALLVFRGPKPGQKLPPCSPI